MCQKMECQEWTVLTNSGYGIPQGLHVMQLVSDDSVECAALLPKCELYDSNISPEWDCHVRILPIIFFSSFRQMPLWMVIYFALLGESLRPV